MTTSLYFFITYTRKQKENSEDVEFIVSDNKSQKPECLFVDEKYENQKYYYNKVFKVDKSMGKGKKKNNFNFEFEIADETYKISFDSQGNTFVYDVNLEEGKKIIIIRRKVSQNKEYIEKIEAFITALKDNGEENLIDELYKETINLYSQKKGFSFLIELFLKIYQKKDLCPELMKKFREMNDTPKENEKNMDRKSLLKTYKSDLNAIASEAEKLLANNNYESIEFYGIVLSYLNFYDYEKFCKIIDELFIKRTKDLFEILLIYKAHLKNPIKQDFYFFDQFINYSILNKDFSVFKLGLDYIKDIQTFIKVFEKNKEEIFKKFNSSKFDKIINIGNLKFKKIDIPDKTDKIENASSQAIEEDKNEIQIEESNTISKKSIRQCNEEFISTNENNLKNHFISEIIKNMKSIITFSKENNTFLIYFNNIFWQYILNYFNEPKQNNIWICFQLREIFIKYYELVEKIFAKKDNKFTIKKDATSYFEKDEFAFLLDQIIRKYNNNKEVNNIEKLAFITQYNPYYREQRYSNKVDCEIFDSFDLNNIDNDFIEDFRGMNFEIIFKEHINEYIKKIIEKIKSIQDFIKIIKLINIESLENKNVFLDPLNKQYDSIIMNEIGLLSESKLEEAINVSAKIALINYIYETKDKKEFIEKRIKKLDRKIFHLILIEIINLCLNKNNNDNNTREEEKEKEKDEENEEDKENFNGMKKIIFEEFSNKLENESDIDNILNLIDCLEGKNKKEDNQIYGQKEKKDKEREGIKNEFLQKLMSKENLFTKEEFFSSKQSLKILLLYKLYEKGIIKKNEEEYSENISGLLDNIKKDIDGTIKRSKLQEFLKNDKSFILQRLKLINLSYEGFNPNEEYDKLTKKNEEINNDINKLKNIKDNIIIYHKDTYQEIIKKIIEVVKNNQNKQIKDYKGGKISELIKETDDLQILAAKINKVKNFLLFNVIYDMNSGKNENKNFDNAYNELEKIGKLLNNKTGIIEFNKQYKEILREIKKKLSNDEDKAQEFIRNLIEFYKITDKNLIDDELTILFKSKKYELDINSIIFFFENFEKDNNNWNEKLPPRNYYLKLEEKSKEDYEEIDFQKFKVYLNTLKTNGIYDYQNIGIYNKLFTCLYDNKEAIDFLFSKKSEEIIKLKDKIQPTDRTISIKDIIRTENCVFHIEKMKKEKDNFKIFEHIKSMSPETISDFENYSKIYSSIIELDTNEDFSDNIYDKINNIIKDATFNILQDRENFLYYNDEIKTHEGITMEELIHLKNQVHIKKEKENGEDDIIKSKKKNFDFF